MHVIMPSVSLALCDPVDEVREAAALAFDRLYKSVSNKAIDDVVPGMTRTLFSICGKQKLTILYRAAQIP